MVQVMLAVDTILETIISDNSERIDRLLDDARDGKAELLILHEALCWALFSVRPDDHIHVQRLAELLTYSQIQISEFVGSKERSAWIPKQEDVDHWRSVALSKDAP